MIRFAITVSLVPETRGGPFVFWDGIPAACQASRRLGFDAVEIFPPSADALQGVGKTLADNKVSLAAVGTGAGWVKHKLALTSADPTGRQAAIAFVRSIIDAAGEHGAPAIIGSMQGRHDGTPTAKTLLLDALRELGEHAAKHGQPLLYEPLNRYETNLTNTLAQGVALLAEAGSPHVLLLADLFHMHIEEDDSAAALRAAGAKVGHVHFVDTNRKPAGLGQMNYAPLAEALRDIKYDRYLSAEAFSFPDAERAAAKTIETFRRFFPR